jgi:uncharacterized membrane protein YdjX (TVP38/TMEM64 family)
VTPPAPAVHASAVTALRGVAVALWALLLGGYAWVVVSTGRTPLDVLAELVTFLAEHPWGPALFVLVYVARPLVAFSATVLTVGAGYLYGPFLGLLVVTVGANGGALLAYGLGRWLGAGLAGHALAHPRLVGVAGRLRARAFDTVLTLRFLFAPYDAVNYLAGALRLHPVPFVLATVLGSLPGSLTFLLFGASVGDLGALAAGQWPSLDPWMLAASAALLVASLAASRALRRRAGGGAGDRTGGVA